MPDLGKYSDTVLSAYGVSILLLLSIVALTVWTGRRVRAELRDVETRKDHGA